ncbi:MAG: LysR family transcriptional regulator, partial [Actinobacteria bacterium]|nr:LysR family transcriptional regulator [Actinomycetota bacterium]
ESDEMTTIAGLVAAGLGVSILPAGAAAGSGAVEAGLQGAAATRVISLAWSTRRTPTPPVVALRRHLVTHGPSALAAPDGS